MFHYFKEKISGLELGDVSMNLEVLASAGRTVDIEVITRTITLTLGVL